MWDIEEDWLENRPEIRQVAKRCQHAMLIHEIVGQPNQVHLLITADELDEDADQMSAEARDSLSELPVHMMHACESYP